MSKHILNDGTVVTVTHVMADGTVRDSVKGYEIPFNETTYPLYYVLASNAERLYKEHFGKSPSK